MSLEVNLELKDKRLFTDAIKAAVLEVVAPIEAKDLGPYMTIEKTCEVLGVNRNTLNSHYIEKGLKVIKFGRNYRIRPQDLAEFIEENYLIQFPNLYRSMSDD